MNEAPAINRRILLIDDNPAIHEDFQKILVERDAQVADIDRAAADFFGDVRTDSGMPHFELSCTSQGEEGLLRARTATDAGHPFALAFVDMRMPPGWDGLETIRRLWEVDRDLEIVLCTAYSDHSYAEIHAGLGTNDRLLILKKPFDTMEVQQMALALTEKWNLRRRQETRHAQAETAQRRQIEAILEAHRAQLQCVTDRLRALIPPVHDLLATAMNLATSNRPDQVQTLARHVRRDGESINQLVRDLQRLSLLHIAAPRHTPEPVPLLPACRRALEASAIMAGLKGLRLQIDSAPGAQPAAAGDSEAVEQLLILLVDLAVRHVEEGLIRLVVKERPEDRELDLSLHLPAEAQVFTPSSWAAESGPAAALALATRLASLQGGRVTRPAAAAPDSESQTIIVTLPLADPPRPSA